MTKKFNKRDIIGSKFGRLYVLEYGHAVRGKNSNKYHFYICRCSCGKYTLVKRNSLITSNTRSCGCMKAEHTGGVLKHGLSRKKGKPSVYYKLHENIKKRIFYEGYAGYCYYGGRNLTMEPEWVNSFEKFYEYIMENLGPKPEGHVIDRIDNDLGYLKGNLRWATYSESRRNQRRMK